MFFAVDLDGSFFACLDHIPCGWPLGDSGGDRAAAAQSAAPLDKMRADARPGKRKMGTEWYVLRTKPKREEAVTTRLLCAPDTEVFFPRLVESTRLLATRCDRVAPMFPSYLFIKVDVERKGIELRYLPGVRDFLRSNGTPEPVSEDIISTLRERVGPAGVYQPPPQRPERGDRLRIEDGPLRGIDVIFERELSGSERVAVLLAEVQLQARVVLSATSLASV